MADKEVNGNGGWLPKWMLQFVAGAALTGAIAWATVMAGEITDLSKVNATQSAEIAVLKEMARQNELSNQRVEATLLTLDSKIEVLQKERR